MDTLVHIDVVEEPAQLADSISMVVVVRQVNFLLFDGPDEPLGIAVLPSLLRRILRSLSWGSGQAALPVTQKHWLPAT